MLQWFYTGLTIFLAFVAQYSQADDDSSGNYREQCRKVISGTFASALADKNLVEDQVTLAENFQKKSQIQLDAHEKKMKELQKKLAVQDSNPELLSDRDVISSQIKLFHEQVLTSQAQLESARKQMNSTRSRLAILRKKIEALMKVFMTDDPEGGARPVYHKLEWRHKCPAYRSLCPLPEKEVSVLISLLDDIDDFGMSCYRYSKIK